jgi:hypothetical protein
MTSNQTPSERPKQNRNLRSDLWAAFKDVSILFSFTVNIVLVIVFLILIGWIIFPTKTEIVEPMMDELQTAINALDTATIYRTIQIDQQVPVDFVLPVRQSTTVVLSEAVPVSQPAVFTFPAGGGQIRGTVSLNLPAGTELPVYLEMDVPVQNKIHVQFPVEVAIPLNETELNAVVVKLNDVLQPVRKLLDDLPDGF